MGLAHAGGGQEWPALVAAVPQTLLRRSLVVLLGRLGGQGAGKPTQRGPLPGVDDAGEGTREFQQQRLLLRGLYLGAVRQVLEEAVATHPQRPGDLVQPAGGDAAGALLVLADLLVGHADLLGERLLGQPQHDPPLAYPGTDAPVGVSGLPFRPCALVFAVQADADAHARCPPWLQRHTDAHQRSDRLAVLAQRPGAAAGTTRDRSGPLAGLPNCWPLSQSGPQPRAGLDSTPAVLG